MILVDAYNVLHAPRAIRELPDEAGAGELAAMVAVSRYRRRRAVLICDGGPPPGGLGPAAEPLAEFRYRIEGVEVLYAGPGRDADTLIETLIERDSAPSRLTVVSSDRRLIRAAGRRRAASVSSAEFVRVLLLDAGRAARAWRRPTFTAQVPLSAEQTRYWAGVLGVSLTDVPEAGEAGSATGETGRAASHTPPRQPTAKTGTSRSSRPPQTPARSPAESRAGGRSGPGPNTERRTGPNAKSGADAADPPFALDPLLRAALEEWRGRLTLDDLNMEQWIGDQPPPERD